MMPQPGLVPPVAMSSQKGCLRYLLDCDKTDCAFAFRALHEIALQRCRDKLICCLGVCELRDKPANAETVSEFANSETVSA